MASTPKRTAKERIRGIYEQFEEKGQEFILPEIREEAHLKCQDIATDLSGEAINAIVDSVDDERTRRASSSQASLAGFDTDGSYALGEARRQPKRTATYDQWQEHMAIKDRNAAGVLSALSDEREEGLRLAHWWSHPGVTKTEAIESYLETSDQ